MFLLPPRTKPRAAGAAAALVLFGLGAGAHGQAAAAGQAPATPPAPSAHGARPLGPVELSAAQEQGEAMEREAARLAEVERRAQEQAAEQLRLRQAVEAEREARRTEAEESRRALADVAARAAARRPPVTASVPGLSLTGFAQIDYQVRQSSEDQLNPSTGDPLNQDRFLLRRARLRAVEERGVLGGAIELDLNTVNGNTARVVGAEASLRWPPADGTGTGAPAPPLVMGTAGLFKIPFGFEVPQSDRDRPFMERSTVMRALFPGEYDVGARVQGGWRFLRYAAAAQNGEPLGERAFPARDPNAAKDLTGRLGVDVEIVPGVTVAGGFSSLFGKGFHKGTPASKDTLVWRDLNEDGVVGTGEIQVIPGQAATPSLDFSRFALGGDLRVTLPVPRLGALSLYGELITGKNLDRGIQIADPVSSGRDLRERGYYAALVQELGPCAYVGVRYDVYNPDVDASDTQLGMAVPSDTSLSTLAVVGAWRSPWGRLMVEWDGNRNHFGRTSTGAPANLKDNAVLMRAEAKF